MYKCFLTAVTFLIILLPGSFAQHTPLDRCVRDSLFRIKPHESQVQKAIIYLELADLIQESLPQKSFSYIVSAFRIAIRENNDSLKAKSRIHLGDYYAVKRRFMQAHEQYLAAWKTNQRIKDTTGQIVAFGKIGSINRALKNYPKALTYLKQGICLAQTAKDKSMNGSLFSQVGLTYQAMGYKRTALYFFNRALTLFKQAGDKKNECEVQIHMGSYYLDEDRNEEGLAFYENLLHETNSNYYDLIAVLNTRISHIYSKMHDYRKSLQYDMKALKIRMLSKSFPGINSSLINIAGDYYNLGIPDSGRIFMDSGLAIAYHFDRKSLIENGYRHLYRYYQSQGDFKKALSCYGRYSTVHDDIIMEQSRNNIAILETNQKLQQVQQKGKVDASKKEVEGLSLKYHDYQWKILIGMLWMSGFFMLIFLVFLMNIRRVRKTMQQTNIQLQEEIREREATEEQTRDRENQYKFITDNSIDFITHMDSHNHRIYASPAAARVYGYEPEEIMTKSPQELIHPDFIDYEESNYREMIATRASRQFVYQAVKKDGTVFWVESILNPLFDPINGVFKGMVGVTRNIQERKTKELEIMEGTKQKENLLKEIHHRVKNNFAILVSLINMQMAQTKNEELLQSLTNLQLRIRTMALVHEMLYRSNDFEKISFPGYLRSLASVIAGTYNRRDVELTVEADEVVMDIEASIPLGLIINEILSNAYKHAFPDGRTGKIEILFTLNRSTGIRTLVLRDNGIGMPAGVNIDQFKTMGLQVVTILCHQIEGNLVVVNDPGASFTLTFQVEEK
ncbi:MAG: tetratricopeptide repeat-containing sensor histidine kinase [Bacteroidales bacterium]